jgi:PEP-CTERM motif
MKLHRYVTGIALAVGLSCTTAYADSVQFTVVDGVNTLTFDLSQSPTPSLVTSNAFYVDNVPVTVDSNGFISHITENVDFYDASSGAEFVADSGSWYAFDISTINTGALFTGSNSAPTFVPGTYTGGSGDSVTIAAVPTPVPLPSTLPLMIAGFGGVGLFARHRRANA